MIYRNGIYYDRMIRNGVTYDRMVRNGVVYGSTGQPPEADWIMNLNFSEAGQTDDNAAGWNQARFTLNGSGQVENVTSYSFSNLLDEAGNNTGATFQVTFADNLPGVSYAGISQSFPIPQIYMRDFYTPGVAAGNSVMTWRISGLDPASKYDIRGIPYIDSGVNAKFSVDGRSTWTPDPTAYPTTTSFDDPNYITINDVSPNGSGQITIDVASGSPGDWFSVLSIRIRKK